MYDRIKNMPTSRDGKMLFGIFAAFVAREFLNQGISLLPTNPDGAFFAFLMTAFLLYSIGLSVARYDNGRPLFEPVRIKRK
jgi:hypothetical protein